MMSIKHNLRIATLGALRDYLKKHVPDELSLLEEIDIAFKYNHLQYKRYIITSDFQTGSLIRVAKQLNIVPMILAKNIAEMISSNLDQTYIEKCFETSPGFLNFMIKDSYLEELANSILSFSAKKKTILLDFGGVNIAKPLHIGHIRSMILGESTRRFYLHMGYKVVTDIHLGDFGTQMGMIIAGIQECMPNTVFFIDHLCSYPATCPVGMKELEVLYPQYVKACQSDAAKLKRAHHMTTLVQQRTHKGVTALWKLILEMSLEHIRKITTLLDIHFDLWKGESDVVDLIPNIIRQGLAEGTIFEDQGALMIDTHPFHKMMIMKSDGSALYTTTDIATILDRLNAINPDEMIYIVDKRQELHFSQVFTAAKRLGIVTRQKLFFLGFGTINDEQGKPFKTRDGSSLNLSDVIADTMTYVRNASEDNIHIALSSIKFSILSHNYQSDYKFDIKKFTQYEGKTALYIIYTASRIKSILKQMDKNDIAACKNRVYTALERAILLLLSQLQDVFDTIEIEHDLSILCNYVYDLCKTFNSLYGTTNFLKEKDLATKAGYLMICHLVHNHIELISFILGITLPDTI